MANVPNGLNLENGGKKKVKVKKRFTVGCTLTVDF